MRPSTLAGVVVVLAALGAAPMTARVAGAAHLSVELSDGLMSLDAAGVPLRSILDEIARASDVRIRTPDGDASDETLTTLVLERVRIDEAMRRLLQGRDFVLVYS